MSDEIGAIYQDAVPEITAGETNVEGLTIQYLKYGYQIDTLSDLFPILVTLDDGRGLEDVKEIVKDALSDTSSFDIRAPGGYDPPPVDNNRTRCHVKFICISPTTDPELVDEVSTPQVIRLIESFKQKLEADGNLYRHSGTANGVTYAKFFLNIGRAHELQLPYPTSKPTDEGQDSQLQTTIPCYILTETTPNPTGDTSSSRRELVTIRWTYPVYSL
ncbi:hypothetical protein [Natronobacterium texcoconense]|uniref:Uncharacterized protein n=1 Tax=Natronobacterium texcoconense TaxID=1095778 RepID=A0A1H1CED7_NATTX|nr:hypothetical protein [Natronobacterium texcoconense]SDQ62545.1 hypothetical protein SAMN04489842_1376 [Natronobacterium texcoconense]